MIHTDRTYFKDDSGRVVLLRGVNLGGSSKVPAIPNGSTWNLDKFYDHRNVSFVGRPLPLTDADEHFGRLKLWGFTFLRFLITWEAIEHEGPGIYDEEYLDYLHAIVVKAAEYGIEIFMDPHQDVWSRFTGGDGAPGWTLEAVGFDISKLHSTGAAFTHQECGEPYPRMLWPTNNNKLAAATMFTLFFAGNDFAPELKVEGIPIQEFLQSHYINAIKKVAAKLSDLPNVVGYDTLNEPSPGYIGMPDISKRLEAVKLLKGETPTAFQAMAAGAGFPQKVDVFDLGLTGFIKTGKKTLNPGGESAWLNGLEDVWQQHKVWGLDKSGTPVILQPQYFSEVDGHPVDFYRDYFRPFLNLFIKEIRLVASESIFFLEGVPGENGLSWGKEDLGNIVHAAHWYDDITLVTKRFVNWFTMDTRNAKVVLGKRAVQHCFSDQIADTIRHSINHMGEVPTLIGETGIPFDMYHKRAYQTGDFKQQEGAMDATMAALEDNLASFTLWNYTSDNTNEHGDQWNNEDLSIFSQDQRKFDGSPYDGGRAIKAVVRPYPRKTAGIPIHLAFNMGSSTLEYVFEHVDNLTEPTEIFIPVLHYPHGCLLEVSDGTWELNHKEQILRYQHTPDRREHTIRISPATKASKSLNPSSL
jgi:hypothetical protein